MTDQTPIERAARELASQASGGVCQPSDPDIEWQGWTPEARTAYEAIDTNQLTAIILRTELPGGIKVGHANKIALAVKNWLTGKEQT